MWKSYIFILAFIYFNASPTLCATSLFQHIENVESKVGNYFTFSRNAVDEEFARKEDALKSHESHLDKVINDETKKDLPDSLKWPNPSVQRSKRSANTQQPVDLSRPVDLQDPNLHLIVHWAGFNSSVLVVLTKNISSSRVTSSNIYFSYDYGKTFIRKMQSADQARSTNSSGSGLISALVSSFYSTNLDIRRYLFVDLSTRTLYATTDFGKTIVRRPSVSFSLDKISFHPTNPSILLCLDKTGKGLYKSDDLGYSWTKIQTNVKSFQWGYSGSNHYDKEDSLYVERNEPGGTVSVLRSETYFTSDVYDQVLISNVEDFLVMNDSMFATRRENIGNNRELWIAVNRRSRFAKANFHTSLPTKEFFIVDASDSQIMVCVQHAESKTHLYISQLNEIDFELSLENITYYNPETSTSFLSLYASERFADIHKVSGMRSIYIANILNSSRSYFDFDAANMHTVITFNKGGLWELLPAPEQNGQKANCTARDGCSLHLNQEFHHSFPRTSTSLIYSQASAPGYILAQGNVGKKIKYETNLYFSSTAGTEWTEVLSGTWIYTWGDHGGIIVALLKFEKTDTLWYSTNQGELWNTFKFSNESIRVYGLMTEPGETSSVFTLFGSSNEGSHSWLLIQVNFTSIFSGPCDDSDYKKWSPADERGITCLLGSQTTFERRTKHSVCFNGRNYDRPTSIKPCLCTREDFQCDVGYSTQFFGYLCSPDAGSTSAIDTIPPTCQAGAFYNRTKGYRKIAGDRCSGGSAESHYAPDVVPCPAVEENAFMFVSSRLGLHRIDMVNNDTAVINPYVTGAVDIEFSYQLNTLFWANSTILYATNLNTSATTKLFQHSTTISHISLDWFTSNLYWTDNNGRLYVTNMKSVTRQLDINCSRVNEVVAVPLKGKIYIICSSGNVYLSQLNLDGSNQSHVRTIGYSLSGVSRRVALTYDPNTDRLFWILFNHLKSCFRDGSGYRSLVNPYGQHLEQLSIFKSNLYWLSKRFRYNSKNMIHYADKYQYSTESIFNRGPPSYQRITAMKIFVRHSQLTKKVNPCISRKCSQLCVPLPSDKGMVGQCLCGKAKDLVIEYDPSGNERCSCPPGEVYNTSAGYCQTTNQTCSSEQYLCSNQRCIMSIWKCDGENDCGDLSDEYDCPQTVCRANQFECNSTKHCIPKHWKCDHDRDCTDGSDEAECVYPTCSPNQFTCSNSICIDPRYVCDGDNDCRDWSDEKNCSSRTSNITNKCNPTYQFFCANPSGFWSSNCLPRFWVCDGTVDCEDGLDESNCTNSTSTVTCPPFQRACDDGACRFEWFWCDGTNDCNDHSDEANCPITTPAPSSSPPITRPFNQTCSGTDLKCAHTGNCYPMQWRCDGVDDCGDSSDEFDCPVNASTSPSLSLPCISDLFQFRCANGRCILLHYKCDSDNDCGDWSDEKSCPNYNRQDDGCIVGYGINYQGTRSYTKTGRTCQRWDSNHPHKPHYWPQDPHNNYCRDPDNDQTGPWCYTTDPDKRWDFCGIPHCSTHNASPPPPTAEPKFCSDGYLDCGAGTSPRCIFDRFACDGQSDCSNGADEFNCNMTCTATEFRCANSRCISSTLRCNYNNDCSDNSDEVNCTSQHISCTSPSAYKCNSGTTCIPRWKVCDGVSDCPSGGDERNCNTQTTTAIAPSVTYRCGNGQRIPYYERCNYKLYCKDSSDEAGCNYVGRITQTTCVVPNSKFACTSISFRPDPSVHPIGYVIFYSPISPTIQFNVNTSKSLFSKTPSFKLTDLLFHQGYNYGIAYNFTNYTLPLGHTSRFITAQSLPDPPTIKKVSQIEPGRILVEWKPNIHPKAAITGYTARVYNNRGAELTDSVTSYYNSTTIAPVNVGLYKVQVRTMSEVGAGYWSSPYNISVHYGVFSSPRTPSIVNKTSTSATIKWYRVAGRASSYVLEVKSVYNPIFYQLEKKFLANITSFTLNKLAPGEQYQARITAVHHANSYGPSSSWRYFTTNGTTENYPQILNSSKALSTTSIRIDWSPVKSKVSSTGLVYWLEHGAGTGLMESPIAVNNNHSIVVKNLPKNQLLFFRVSVHSPYIGRWSPFYHIKPLPDYSDAPTDLVVKVIKPFHVAQVCWVSTYLDTQPLLFYQVSAVDTQSNKVIYNQPGTHLQTLSQIDRHICNNITGLKPSHVYTVSIKDIYHGHVGKEANLTFLNEKRIPRIGSLKVVGIRGTNIYEVSYYVRISDKPFYEQVIRGVLVTLCTGKDVPSLNNSNCSSYNEIPAKQYQTLLTNLKNSQWYTVFLTLKCASKLDCNTQPVVYSFQTTSAGVVVPSPSSNQPLGQTSVIAIAVSGGVIILCLLLVIVFFVRRNRRLQHSYSAFVSSHYNPQSGEAIFVDDRDAFDNGLDDEGEADTPLIGGFADDEPLIVA